MSFKASATVSKGCLVDLLGKAEEQGIAEEFANFQRGQPHLQLPSDDHAVGAIDDDREP
jgi:hypothetical protein